MISPQWSMIGHVPPKRIKEMFDGISLTKSVKRALTDRRLFLSVAKTGHLSDAKAIEHDGCVSEIIIKTAPNGDGPESIRVQRYFWRAHKITERTWELWWEFWRSKDSDSSKLYAAVILGKKFRSYTVAKFWVGRFKVDEHTRSRRDRMSFCCRMKSKVLSRQVSFLFDPALQLQSNGSLWSPL